MKQATEYPDREYIARTLAEWEPRFDPARRLVSEVNFSPGYHTLVPDGDVVHSTRTNLHYAILLLQAGGAERAERAEAAIRQVLALQDTDPVSRTYGIWPWFFQEPLERMVPPDWNWADFCGAALGHVLAEHAGQVSPELAAQIRAALGHAAWSIFRRNITSSYTNIAIMGSGVTTLAGEILDEPRLLDYGRRRMHAFLEYTRFHGGFNEYNSPTYTLVALNELERVLQLVHDLQMRADAEEVRGLAWQTIADHFHPPTAQWAGPHSRAYDNYLYADSAQTLAAMTGVPIPLHPRASDSHEIQLVRPLACPEDLAGRFRRLPAPEVELIQAFKRRPDGSIALQGTTWLAEGICLGSINRDSLWTQRRPLLAYWRTPEDPAVALRLRFLKDGRDFATPYVTTAQHKNRALSAVGLAEKMGDFHLHLDPLTEGIFPAADLRLRYELNGAGAAARQVEADAFELSAGEWRAMVRTAPGQFGPLAVAWSCGTGEEQAWVDAVCWAGERRYFLLKEYAQVRLAAGLELLRWDEPYSPLPLEVKVTGGMVQARWEPAGVSLAVELPFGVAPPIE